MLERGPPRRDGDLARSCARRACVAVAERVVAVSSVPAPYCPPSASESSSYNVHTITHWCVSESHRTTERFTRATGAGYDRTVTQKRRAIVLDHRIDDHDTAEVTIACTIETNCTRWRSSRAGPDRHLGARETATARRNRKRNRTRKARSPKEPIGPAVWAARVALHGSNGARRQ